MQINAEYNQILEALKQKKADLIALSKRYRQTKMQDYFDSSLGQTVREALLRAEGRAEVCSG
jgi:hypothetical protein